MKKSPINVLWVEDSIDDVDIFSMAFKKADARLKFDVKIDGAEALQHLMSIRATPALHPDVILLDLNLPKRDGREVLADIKKCEELRSIPVVILTTSNADPDVAWAYALGASFYLVKPVDISLILNLAKSLSGFLQQVEWVRRE